MTSKFVYKNMNEEGTSYRPEQLLLAKLLRDSQYVRGIYEVKTEYPVTLENHDGKRTGAILDIVMLPYKTGEIPPVAIRMMGEIHEKPKKKISDADQRIYLEKIGWIVYDIYKDIVPEYWNPKKHDRKELMKITESIFSWVVKA